MNSRRRIGHASRRLPLAAYPDRGTMGTGGHGIPHRAIVGTRKNRGARLLHEL
jgi:hypothetical protein